MARNDGGVLHYTEGKATITVFFPEGQETCQFCEFLYNDRGLGRCRCELQHGKIIPLDCITYGREPKCPLNFENKEE